MEGETRLPIFVTNYVICEGIADTPENKKPIAPIAEAISKTTNQVEFLSAAGGTNVSIDTLSVIIHK